MWWVWWVWFAAGWLCVCVVQVGAGWFAFRAGYWVEEGRRAGGQEIQVIVYCSLSLSMTCHFEGHDLLGV